MGRQWLVPATGEGQHAIIAGEEFKIVSEPPIEANAEPVPDPKKFGAITLDTSVIEALGTKLESGLLEQLSQFVGSPIKVLLSEIVIRELHTHLTAAGQAAANSLSGGMRGLEIGKLLTASQAEAVDDVVDALDDIPKLVDARLDRFQQMVAAEILPGSLADSGRLSALYFAGDAPFGTNANKKHEFPDAIALLSIEQWAKDHGKPVLVVAKDNDWAAFGAANSDHVTVVDDLGAALELLQEHADQVRAQVVTLLATREDVVQQIISAAIDGMASWPVEAEYNSMGYAEIGDAEFLPTAAEIVKTGDAIDFAIVSAKEDEIVVSIPVRVTGTAYGDFSVSVWDSIDKEYVGLGGARSEVNFEEEAAVLATFSVMELLDDIELLDAEFIDADGSVDFGMVEPDYGEEEPE